MPAAGRPFDDLIMGGGSAGCVPAHRLSALIVPATIGRLDSARAQREN